MDKNYIIFKKCGRLGNAVFRYLASILFMDKYNFEYILEDDLDGTSLKNLFKFVKGRDYVGNDIAIVHSRDINIMMKEFLKINNAHGFNTLGYVKKDIDENNLVSNTYINDDNGHGIYLKNYFVINDNNFISEYYSQKNESKCNIIMDGYFQHGNIYLELKDKIFGLIEKYKNIHYIQEDTNKRYLMKDLFDDIDIGDKKYDIVINIRLGDFNGRIDYIGLEYYIKLFETIDFNNKRICIVHEKFNRKEDLEYIIKCIKWFKDRGLTVVSETNDVLTDFNIMKQTDTLICSNSTFSWCAAYLSKHINKCYMPDNNWSKERPHVNFKKPIENTIFFHVESSFKFNFKVLILSVSENNKLRLKSINKLKSFIESIGIDCEIFEGINGKNIEIKDTNNPHEKLLVYGDQSIIYNDQYRINKVTMKKSELACGWGQLNIYKKLVEDREYKNYIIFEDDAEIICNQEKFLDLINNVPYNFDLCHIALSDWYPFIKLNKVNNFYYTIKKNYFNRATGYILSKSGAQKLLEKYPNQINVPADDLLCMTYNESNDFKLYVPENYVVKEIDNNVSTMDFYLK